MQTELGAALYIEMMGEKGRLPRKLMAFQHSILPRGHQGCRQDFLIRGKVPQQWGKIIDSRKLAFGNDFSQINFSPTGASTPR